MWDRVLAGSSMIVVFLAVAILLSAKKQLLSVRMARDVRLQLDSVRLFKFYKYVQAITSS